MLEPDSFINNGFTTPAPNLLFYHPHPAEFNTLLFDNSSPSLFPLDPPSTSSHHIPKFLFPSFFNTNFDNTTSWQLVVVLSSDHFLSSFPSKIGKMNVKEAHEYVRGAISRFIRASKEASKLGADPSAIIDMRSSLNTRFPIHN
ncbi:Non-specific phospholipase C6 [Sesamum alatum]|uniref:Non-specific phospholipase C6 n=1 Tax=Sesamum alatum TaxID=300844 RepID=A0AAE1YMP7_9LAMI|nr:Non-specific phospholipase C6 [Sesamum alatum]